MTQCPEIVHVTNFVDYDEREIEQPIIVMFMPHQELKVQSQLTTTTIPHLWL